MTLSHADVRAVMVAHHGLAEPIHPEGAAGVRALLARRRCIQLDPLDAIGTNADLVALARVDGIVAGDVYRHLLPGHAFEHFAKERCLLPPDAFPRYREHCAANPGWHVYSRMRALPDAVVDDVLAEVAARGPVTPAELADRGRVTSTGHAWAGTAKTATLALRRLCTEARVVVCGRTTKGKVYDIPARALPAVYDLPAPDDRDRAFAEDLAEAAGFLPEAAGPWWGPLAKRRKAVTARLVDAGALVRVGIAGTRRTWLIPPDLLDRPRPTPDDRLRILGPLDPLLWDRKLLALAFGFEYVWEVYKPKAQRRWGYYVCPLLHRGRLVGRIEAHKTPDGVVVDRLWEEPDGVDRAALAAAIARHGAAVRKR